MCVCVCVDAACFEYAWPCTKSCHVDAVWRGREGMCGSVRSQEHRGRRKPLSFPVSALVHSNTRAQSSLFCTCARPKRRHSEVNSLRHGRLLATQHRHRQITESRRNPRIKHTHTPMNTHTHTPHALTHTHTHALTHTHTHTHTHTCTHTHTRMRAHTASAA